MRKLQMVDLHNQYLKIKDEIDKAILDVVDSSAFINGPETKAFAEDLSQYLKVKHVIPCANGTEALQISMMALGLQPGDEVITTTFTFIATAEVIALLHLTPVLVDVQPNTFNIDIKSIKEAITPRTKAIVPVHLFGQCANMEEILKIAREYNLFVIEDNCQALGAEYRFTDGSVKKSGTIGNVGATSFFPSKNLGCYGDGGAIFTNDDNLAEKIRITTNHGMAVRYYHDYIGVNSRLDSIQAAILRVKLKHLDEYIEARRIAAEKYNKAFEKCPNVITPKTAAYTNHTFHQYTLVLRDVNRNDLQKYLNDNGIPAAIYYPVPLHKQKAYTSPKYKEGDFPISEMLCNSVISLPMHTELDDEQIEFITSKVLEFIHNQ